MHQGYLVAVGLIGLLWLAAFASRKDVRRKMLWCGGYCVLILSAGFLAVRILFSHLPEGQQIVPGYWSPDTLFDLARVTGGWSIEDALYMFFTGGIASVLYDILRRSPVPFVESSLWQRRRAATLIGAAAACGVAFLPGINLMWALITFCGVCAFVIWFERPDLITRSLLGGIFYVIIYYPLMSFFLVYVFPSYFATATNLSNLSGLMLGWLPLEEVLFALFFGFMWSPVYEYAKDIRVQTT